MKKLGLIGYPISHSFSKKLFEEKFLKENIIGYQYDLYPLPSIEELPALLKNNPELLGLNVTIPYKVAVIPLLDVLDDSAINAGAVNTILIKRGKLIGYNTDMFGFQKSLNNFYKKSLNDVALILGTGGSAKAVAAVLQDEKINYNFVSRNLIGTNIFNYEDLNEDIIKEHRLIINCTAVGMSPLVDEAPGIPYHAINDKHFLFDLIYNPTVTLFLKNGRIRGAETKNGLEMLYLQASRAWEIWVS